MMRAKIALIVALAFALGVGAGLCWAKWGRILTPDAFAPSGRCRMEAMKRYPVFTEKGDWVDRINREQESNFFVRACMEGQGFEFKEALCKATTDFNEATCYHYVG